jgi:hypothetical protein
MQSKEDELLLATEVARSPGCRYARWNASRGAGIASRDRDNGAGACTAGWPPKGVWAMPRESLRQLEAIRKPVGYPGGKARKKAAPSTES